MASLQTVDALVNTRRSTGAGRQAISSAMADPLRRKRFRAARR